MNKLITKLNEKNNKKCFKKNIEEYEKLNNLTPIQRPKKTKSLKDIVFNENYSLIDCGWEH